MRKINKAVLAFSGGLDTSVILKWLQDTYQCEVVTFTADIGQGEEVEPARAKAKQLGVKEIYIDDLREEFVRDFVFPMFRANTIYEGDREHFEIFINRKNKDWIDKDIFLELIIWEDFLGTVSQTRLQDEYNKAIEECDIFVMLFATKVGQYTEEEFETAFKKFKASNKPFIFTYYKDTPISSGNASSKDLLSLERFQKKLGALEHFYTTYKNIDELKYKFNQQLDKLAANGFIEFKPNEIFESMQNPTIDISDSKNIVAGSTISVGGDFIVGDNASRK